MADTIIENPILNSPFREPDRHWRFTDEGITNEIVNSRRQSAYFVARDFLCRLYQAVLSTEVLISQWAAIRWHFFTASLPLGLGALHGHGRAIHRPPGGRKR